MRRPICSGLVIVLLAACVALNGCNRDERPHIVVGSKFFTEQVILAELLAQHIEARLGVPVTRKSNLGGTLLCQKALLAGQLDTYVEYTGTALTAVLGESPGDVRPQGDATAVYEEVKKQYAQRFGLVITEPLGFENSFAMVVRGTDAREFGLKTMSHLVRVAPRWRAGVGYEFLERPDGYTGWAQRYGLHFAETPRVMDLGLIYRALVERQVDVVAGNSTDGLIEALKLYALEDDRRYFPPYSAVPIVRRGALEKFPGLREALTDLGGKVTSDEMRHMNYLVDAEQRDVRTVVAEFRRQKGL